MRFLFVPALAALAGLCQAQGLGTPINPDLAKILTFETQHPNGKPGGWGGGPPSDIFIDDKVVHGGQWSTRIERTAGSQGTFSTITMSVPIAFTGEKIELRGFLRMEDVAGSIALWMREDSDSGSVGFDTLERQQLKGTADWKEYSVSLPVHPQANSLFVGFLLAGTGKAWVDDMQLLVDGKPIWEAPKVEPAKTPLDTDHEFDTASGIALNELTTVQTASLATLGKVWGFLKYHHPNVTAGKYHWDYDLFRVLPAVLAAPDRAASNAAILKWITALGPTPTCDPCTRLDEKDIHLRPALEWTSDESLLGAALSRSLRAILTTRPIGGKQLQFYVTKVRGIGNPVFEHEAVYNRMKLPDAGFQILALYRFWNIIQYWFPYRDVIGENWEQVLAQFIPRIALAKNSEAYQRELMALIARVHDTHANLWSSIPVRPPVGVCQLPVIIRFIENRAVVTGYSASEAGPATGLKPGDAILQLNGEPVSKLVETWSPFYAASNDPTRLRDIARSMTNGECGDVKLRVHRQNDDLDLTAKRVPSGSLEPRSGATHDLPGDTFRMLSEDVAYLKLSSVKAASVAGYIDSAARTQGLIVDIRNYPSEFVPFALGQLLIDRDTDFVRFTSGDLANPGAFHWGPALTLNPKGPHYGGKIVILIDEVSQSQAEYTTMALRSAPNAKVVGSTTAGADGNVSPIPLPGGFRSMISGIGVFYPDKKPTQRVGIIPDVEVLPTIAGIRSGRDELLEEGIRLILGRDASAAEIEKMIRK